MKKILFLIEDFRFGGVEVSLVNLLNNIDFKQKKYKVVVLMYGTHTDVLNKLKGNKNIRIINVNNKVVQCVENFISKCMNQYSAEKLKNKLVRYLVIRHIKNNNYDVVIRYHHAAIKTLFTRLKKKRNQKFVTWYHRSIPTDYYLNKEYLNNCDKVIGDR